MVLMPEIMRGKGEEKGMGWGRLSRGMPLHEEEDKRQRVKKGRESGGRENFIQLGKKLCEVRGRKGQETRRGDAMWCWLTLNDDIC